MQIIMPTVRDLLPCTLDESAGPDCQEYLSCVLSVRQIGNTGCQAYRMFIGDRCANLISMPYSPGSLEMKKSQLWTALAIGLLLLVSMQSGYADQPWTQSGAKVGQEITGPDGAKMVWVPAGEFTMGADDLGAPSQPVHKVVITKGFWLGKCTVTISQWKRYLGKEDATVQPTNDYPAVCITWQQAVDYCRHYGMSLPTEAQWEYAARGPEGRKYPWGDQWDVKKCCNVDNRGPAGFTWPVGSFPEGTSWCGALDMAGNIWQWCNDWYDERYYANSPSVDPPGPADPTPQKYRVLRGGSCNWDANVCRSAYHDWGDPNSRTGIYGFRCVIVP